MKRYLLLSALSGCVWALIGFLVSLGNLPRWTVVGGMLASPLIGLLIGFIFLPVYKLPKFVQFALSLVTLYLAVALFGLGVGLYDATRNIPTRIATAVVLQSIITAVMGITLSGYMLVLWPLAFLNHRLLRRVYVGAR